MHVFFGYGWHFLVRALVPSISVSCISHSLVFHHHSPLDGFHFFSSFLPCQLCSVCTIYWWIENKSMVSLTYGKFQHYLANVWPHHAPLMRLDNALCNISYWWKSCHSRMMGQTQDAICNLIPTPLPPAPSYCSK